MRQSYIAAAAAAADVRNAPRSDGFRRLETGSSMTPPWNKSGVNERDATRRLTLRRHSTSCRLRARSQSAIFAGV